MYRAYPCSFDIGGVGSLISSLFKGFSGIMLEVFYALLPILIIFIIFQIFVLRLSKHQLKRIAAGVVLSFFGLSFFLQGVNIGFLPVGESMGIKLGEMKNNWILIPIGFLAGFSIAYAEPTVRVLNDEVEKVSGGHINKTLMLYSLSLGVAISIALAMLRVLKGISLWYFLVPGYLLAFFLLRHVDKTFVAIAFDSGGAATGPMTVTFILALTIGAAKGLGRGNPMLDGFGMVSLVALASILSVLLLGYVYSKKEKNDKE